MDERLSIRKLTADVIDACFDADLFQLLGKSLEEMKNTDASDEIAHFGKLIKTSAHLESMIDAVAGDLYVDAERLSRKERTRVVVACSTFFFLGWHARGALEDAEKLDGIAGTKAKPAKRAGKKKR